jgi:hypothetical protein
MKSGADPIESIGLGPFWSLIYFNNFLISKELHNTKYIHHGTDVIKLPEVHCVIIDHYMNYCNSYNYIMISAMYNYDDERIRICYKNHGGMRSIQTVNFQDFDFNILDKWVK